MNTTVAGTNKSAWLLWLTEVRHINEETWIKAGLEVDLRRQELAIPIRDTNGVTLFRKYRRSPWNEVGPKYRYDTGAHCALYGIETLGDTRRNEYVVIAEGELDALALRSVGFAAVSSTGGAGTFMPEWRDLLKGHVPIIIYDNDAAGVAGALRVASILPNARIGFLPRKKNGKEIKDITDFVHAGGAHEELSAIIHTAKPFDLGLANNDDERLGTLIKARMAFSGFASRIAQTPDGDPWHYDTALAYITEEIEKERAHIFKPTAARKLDGDKVANARSYPITKLVIMNRYGFAPCVYHKEKSASMKVYKDNHAYSFCCGKYSDSINIYMALHESDFKTAVDALQIL